ncbi:MAG: hypothetical protein IPJ89_04305 [Candidatus Iainarchaeum archaeon]|uniref:Uncharacterized protein n=1 Tax=Candidatus Iainarchaeum sp. TaxID=3101447 RepID=A0A7T9DJ81_9ARCH|nr:MAG: hypothetical protein IPJ89_04305 [Candidatus Diapherotrites archaeon]
MNHFGKSIFLWGLISLVGYGVYQFLLTDPNFPNPMILWSVLTVIGVAAMLKWVPNAMKLDVVKVWLLISVLGMVYHWLAVWKIVPLFFKAWGYWALLMAIGFLATGYTWKPRSKFYYGVGVLNAIAFVLIAFFPSVVGMYGSALLAIVTGVPLLYDGWKTK